MIYFTLLTNIWVNSNLLAITSNAAITITKLIFLSSLCNQSAENTQRQTDGYVQGDYSRINIIAKNEKHFKYAHIGLVKSFNMYPYDQTVISHSR